jgi:hypothetical protein
MDTTKTNLAEVKPVDVPVVEESGEENPLVRSEYITLGPEWIEVINRVWFGKGKEEEKGEEEEEEEEMPTPTTPISTPPTSPPNIKLAYNSCKKRKRPFYQCGDHPSKR